MLRTMMKSKIHRATVTQADLHYVGSVTVDEDLLDAADLIPGEQVAIVDITNGARLETYVIPGGPGDVILNGAAARLVHRGDTVIVVSYAEYEEEERNRIIDTNLRGMFLCMKHEIPLILKQVGGAIVNTSSGAGVIGIKGSPAYTAAKHGVDRPHTGCGP